jgi:iron complex outermembrane receptor protein
MGIDSGRSSGRRTDPARDRSARIRLVHHGREIARFGYRTLADILRGVRGMAVADDRNFSLLGARACDSGDYNSRILLL